MLICCYLFFLSVRFCSCPWRTWTLPSWLHRIFLCLMALCLICFLELRRPLLTMARCVQPVVYSRFHLSVEKWSVLHHYVTRLAQKTRATFHLIRSKTKTNCNSLARVFPRFASTTCNYFEFWLVHWVVCVLCDWPEWLLWFWFYNTQLKAALFSPPIKTRISCVYSVEAWWPPDRVVQVQALAGNIVLCSWARHFTLTVPLPPRCKIGYRQI